MAIMTTQRIDKIKDLRALVAKISASIDHYEASQSSGDEETELALIAESAEQLVSQSMKPLTQLFIVCNRAAQLAAIQSAIGMGLLNVLRVDNDTSLENITSELASVEPSLLVRILRTLATSHVLEEKQGPSYRLSALGGCLKEPKYQGMVFMGLNCHTPSWARLPDFLSANGWQNPQDASGAAFNLGHQTQKSIFAWLAEQPKGLEHFHAALGSMADFGVYDAARRAPWPDIIGPVEDTDVAMVDVGGGNGDVLQTVLQKYPNIKGRFILQDLPEVVTKVQKGLDKRIEVMPHDFFTEQPIIGARVYCYRMVLHDWPWDDCRKILQKVKSAMRPGFSKLIINDAVFPEIGVPLQQTLVDMTMMTLGAEEKSERQFRDLLTSEGFVVTNIQRNSAAIDSIIQAELPTLAIT